MDSMVNRYTADRRIRSDDAYTPHGVGGARPDRCILVYAQRVREAYKDTPLVVGGIEASLRRIAHFDYWSEKIRRSALLDAKADLLVYGNAERQICEIAHRLSAGQSIRDIQDMRGTVFVRRGTPAGWIEIDSTTVDTPGRIDPPIDPYAMETGREPGIVRPAPGQPTAQVVKFYRKVPNADRARSVVRMPSFEQVAPTRCSMRTRRGSCISSRTPATRAPWCSGTATSTSGSTRRRSRSRPGRWTASTSCRIGGCRIRVTAPRRSPPTR
jgi:uncharacterized radical SAM protein YgiQ